jgi:hypothetical protein
MQLAAAAACQQQQQLQSAVRLPLPVLRQRQRWMLDAVQQVVQGVLMLLTLLQVVARDHRQGVVCAVRLVGLLLLLRVV